ncbi:hypothetical protein [Massilia sp. CFBP9026]|uniref:hypothetical protein n=1 Tax=Massilia sp. CFBP9026 TaxID=3096536 RepID=UPI002A6B089A|nr:hypothetical protein [Massilia sp. CFBP9026]MDY0965237.1 hypothetical protein [Massilia sp. CFBP9026]
MIEDQSLTARSGNAPVAPRAEVSDPEHNPAPSTPPDNLCRAGSYAGLVTAVRKAVERKADFGS